MITGQDAADLTWLPRLRALSLTSHEDEGEEETLTALSKKLDESATSISSLATQLSSLQRVLAQQERAANRSRVTGGALTHSGSVLTDKEAKL